MSDLIKQLAANPEALALLAATITSLLVGVYKLSTQAVPPAATTKFLTAVVLASVLYLVPIFAAGGTINWGSVAIGWVTAVAGALGLYNAKKNIVALGGGGK